jgi:hypothetical protein
LVKSIVQLEVEYICTEGAVTEPDLDPIVCVSRVLDTNFRSRIDVIIGLKDFLKRLITLIFKVGKVDIIDGFIITQCQITAIPQLVVVRSLNLEFLHLITISTVPPLVELRADGEHVPKFDVDSVFSDVSDVGGGPVSGGYVEASSVCVRSQI